MANNDSNKEFYNTVPLDVFQSLTQQGGFKDCVDLKLIEQQLPQNASVIEVGAGFGRCVDFLLERKHTGKIWAIEQSTPLSKVLQDKYGNISNVEVINADIKTFELNQKADVVLWMFSGLLDFNRDEQPVVLKRLRTFLKDGGILFLDIPQLHKLTLAKFTSEQDILMETPYGNIATFLPSSADIKQYAEESGFKNVSLIDYNTTTDKKRSIYRLEA